MCTLNALARSEATGVGSHTYAYRPSLPSAHTNDNEPIMTVFIGSTHLHLYPQNGCLLMQYVVPGESDPYIGIT